MNRVGGSGSGSGISGNRPVKKIVIKNLKEKPKLPENYEEETWAKLRGAITAIQHKQPIEQSLEELYRACENLCHHNLQPMVYQRLQAECEGFVLSELASLISKSSNGSWLAFLQATNQ